MATDDVEMARTISKAFKERFDHYPSTELSNCAFYEGQSEQFRRWELACLAADRELDWSEFISLPQPDPGDQSENAVRTRELFRLFSHYIYDWHSVAKFFCNHFCSGAYDDWLRACVEQQKDFDPSQFLQEPSPEILREMEQREADRRARGEGAEAGAAPSEPPLSLEEIPPTNRRGIWRKPAWRRRRSAKAELTKDETYRFLASASLETPMKSSLMPLTYYFATAPFGAPARRSRPLT